MFIIFAKFIYLIKFIIYLHYKNLYILKIKKNLESKIYYYVNNIIFIRKNNLYP